MRYSHEWQQQMLCLVGEHLAKLNKTYHVVKNIGDSSDVLDSHVAVLNFLNTFNYYFK